MHSKLTERLQAHRRRMVTTWPNIRQVSGRHAPNGWLPDVPTLHTVPGLSVHTDLANAHMTLAASRGVISLSLGRDRDA
jgi:hypothetical protein